MVLNFCYLDANETSNIQEHFVSVRSEDSRKMNLDLKLQGQNKLRCDFCGYSVEQQK